MTAPESEPTAAVPEAADRGNGRRSSLEVRDAELRRARPQGRQGLRRGDFYTSPVVDGRRVSESAWTRFVAWMRMALTSQAEREEAQLDAKLRLLQRAVTRSNTIAVMSPKGGVGKTTCTFLLGNLLASHLRLRCVAIDANPDFGTLGRLAPDGVRVDRTLADAVASLDRIGSAPELRPYVSTLPSGLHVMAAPGDANVMREVTPQVYGQLIAFLARFYDVILLDLGTGLTAPTAEFALERADHSAIVTTPEWVTADSVLDALRYLQLGRAAKRLTVVLNQASPKPGGDRQVIEAAFRRQEVSRHVTVPYDEQLRTMLDSGTYTLERLARPTRTSIKRFGLTVASQLV